MWLITKLAFVIFSLFWLDNLVTAGNKTNLQPRKATTTTQSRWACRTVCPPRNQHLGGESLSANFGTLIFRNGRGRGELITAVARAASSKMRCSRCSIIVALDLQTENDHSRVQPGSALLPRNSFHGRGIASFGGWVALHKAINPRKGGKTVGAATSPLNEKQLPLLSVGWCCDIQLLSKALEEMCQN